MKPLKEFDYDLWTTGENNEKKYWVRIKRTGEVCEVSHDVLRFLRGEEKQIRRFLGNTNERKGDLSLDTLPDDKLGESWLEDSRDYADEVCIRIIEDDLLRQLTPRQTDVYLQCIVYGIGIREYTRQNSLNYKTVIGVLEEIRKKFKKIWGDIPINRPKNVRW